MKHLFITLAALAVAAQSAPIELSTATAEKKAEVRAAMGLGDAATDNTNEKSLSPLLITELARFHNENAVNNTVTIWTVGDSMMSSSRLPIGLVPALHGRLPIIGYALEEVNTTVVSGTVVSPPANATGSQPTDLWDYGKVWKMQSGAVIKMLNANGQANGLPSGKVIIWCLKQPGGGTATVEYSRNNGSTYSAFTTIDTNGTAGEMARAEVANPSGSPMLSTFRLTATGGPVNFIGIKTWDTDKCGVILANSNMGGLPVATTLLAPSEIRNTIGADMGKTLLIYQFREGPGELTQTVMDNWLDAWTTALPNGEILLIDQLDTPSLQYNDVETPLANAKYLAAGKARANVKNYHINDVLGTETERDHAGFYNATLKGTITANATTNVVTVSASHGLSIGNEVTLSSTGTLPAPLTAWSRANAKRYFVKTVPSATSLTLAATSGGAEIDITDTGSGTHSLTLTDTIHMSADAWRTVGSDIALRLTSYAEGVATGLVYRSGSGGRSVIYGSFTDEYAPSGFIYRARRDQNKELVLHSRGAFGGINKFGFQWKAPTGGTLPDGVTMEFGNDVGYTQPIVVDKYGYLHFGPYNATTQSAYTRGARVSIDEDAAAKSVLLLKHKHATPTVPAVKLENSGGTSVFEISAAGQLKPTIPSYADDAAADADAALLSGQLYRTTAGGRTVYQKP